MLQFVRQVFRGFSLVTLCLLTIPAAVFAVILGGFLFLPLPAHLPEAKSTLPSQGSHIYDVNGKELTILQKFDQNIPVEKSDIPLVMKQATIASEDKNFYGHTGVDVRGIARAFWADFRNNEVSQGGSTITQQYVKLAYTNQERTITRKVREAILASQLDRQEDKEEILYRYLSAVYFGDGAYGIGAASESYFRKPVEKLTLSEAATLVGVIPAPSARAPRANLAEAETFRKLVLLKMFEQRYITQQQYDEALKQTLWLDTEGKAPANATVVYPLQQPPTAYPYFVDYVTKYLKIKYGEDATYRGGLRVQTTLDPELQNQAEKIINDTMKGTPNNLEMSLVAVEPPTGYVRALVGGRDWANKKVNLALGGCPPVPKLPAKDIVEPSCRAHPVPTSGGTGRQPGSSFKAFVLAAAYEQGIKPSTIYPAPSKWTAPDCNYKGCTVENYEGEVFGSTDLKGATAHSINTVYAPLIRDIGIKDTGKAIDGFIHTANVAKKLGATSVHYNPTDQGTGGGYALGTNEVSPLDMAASYSVFANRGMRQEATPIVKIVDPDGKVLEDNTGREAVRALDENVADNVTDTLREVIERGTGANGNLGRPAAGKTGTSENYSNAWFVGYTPTLSTSVWMGYSNSIDTINYKGNRHVAGGSIPTKTWATFMKGALEDVPSTDFTQPAPIKAPDKNALASALQTGPLPIAPQAVRPAKPTPTGDYDQTTRGSPTVDAPPTTAPRGGTTTGGGLQPLATIPPPNADKGKNNPGRRNND